MTYERFEDLPVWKAAMDFAVRVFEVVGDRAFAGCGDARDQLQRASLSISNDIAEGFERGSTAELLMFLYIARGSAGESRSILRFCERVPRFAHLKPQISNLTFHISKSQIPTGEHMPTHTNNYPKLHNAAWPGLVGKGPGSEPPIDLDTMIRLTVGASVDGVKFDGMDLFLFDPHVSIDATDDQLKRLADKFHASNLVVGSVVAPIWPPTGGGAAMGSESDRKQFVEQVRKGCRIAEKLRLLGIRPYGVVRIDSASSPDEWYKDPAGNQKRIAATFRQAADVAEGFGERLAAEGEICWGGMHSWKRMVELLEMVDRPATVGFQADMAHTLLYTMGYNAPEDAILPEGYDWKDKSKLDEALKQLTHALRPWTIDFHVAQNNATVHGSGSHDKTGRHCLATDPTGKLDIPRHAGYWLRNEAGNVIKRFHHICWDGCMFSNETMTKPQTWRDILATMVAVRDQHGWRE